MGSFFFENYPSNFSVEPNVALITLVTLAVGGGYLVWRVSRKIVRVGYYLFYVCIGAALTGTVLFLTSQPVQPGALAIGGIGFSSLVMAIRSKVMRLIGGLTAIGVAITLGNFLGTAPPKHTESGKVIKNANNHRDHIK